MNAAVRSEALKLVRSPVGTIATLALVVGTLVLLGGITAALASGNPELTAKVGVGATLDWAGLLASAAQITSAGGLLGSGVVLAWLFGREFTDGTVVALFALPVGRGRIALGKLAVYAVWLVGVNAALTVGLLGLGAALGYGAPSADTWAGLARQLVLGVLAGASATPVAWVATVTRSLLAGVGGAIGLVVVTQVGVLAGAGGWLPLAAPALWAMSEGTAVTVVQLGLTLVVAAAFACWTAVSWQRMQVRR
ncbi:ABC-2 type transport system permease protein [Georgenia satyanarayanai]|uniref:ABC-2 type transport system permease protein n=1 Tax=Georgenia satyanarayanai TaxID=860221 RepID=A0A2Y9A434_9MICO|nr:ABC transporter permease [Georgenia satyanarayanai]PYG00935.1 ABC-2 type transport system permease protein [Georgenia satyanarayanai]SSA39174.1 ABC-2 type transport system permease protein [Georgenia satyanarayanai]